MLEVIIQTTALHLVNYLNPKMPVADLFWVKKEGMTEGRKASRASKSTPPLPVSSRSGSDTECLAYEN